MTMATPYGGGPADEAIYKGQIQPGQSYRVYDAATGGTQYTTALLDADGVPVGTPYEITSDDYGRIRFQIDGFSGSVYVIAANAPLLAPRVRFDPADLPARMDALEALDVADLDADVSALGTQVTALETNHTALEGRVDSLEAEFAANSIRPGQCVFQAFASVAQSVPNNALTGLTLATPVINEVAGWSGASPTRFTPQLYGRYRLEGAVVFVPNATGFRYCEWQKNAVQLQGGGHGIQPASGAGNVSAVPARPTVVTLDGVTDYVTLQIFQTSGAALNTQATNPYYASVTAYYLGTPA